MDANRDEVHGWWTRLLGGPLAFVGGITFSGRGLSRLAGRRAVREHRSGCSAILGLSGLIYGFLSPDFGLNPQSLVLFISLVIGLGFITFYSEGSASRLATRRFRGERLDQAVRDGGRRGDPGRHHLALDHPPAGLRLRLHRVGRDRRAGRPGQAR